MGAGGGYFLAVAISAHALDEMHGHPLGTRFDDRVLAAVSAVALAGAVAIGIYGAATVSLVLVPLIAIGGLLVVAYSLELFGGRFHTELWFALAGGAFPALTGYLVNDQRLTVRALLITAGCGAMCVGQRRLSAPARELRRRTRSLTGVQELSDGTTRELSVAGLLAPLEHALLAWTAALVLTASAVVAARL